jgi:hypothetical protein
MEDAGLLRPLCKRLPASPYISSFRHHSEPAHPPSFFSSDLCLLPRHIPLSRLSFFLTMAVVKFIHILTVVSLSVLYASFDALPVNALSVERGHFGRDLGHVHAEVAKKRADSSKKCRPRPSSAAQNSVPPNTYSPTATSSTYAPSSTSSSLSTPSTAPASSVNSKIMYAFSNNEQPSIPNFLTGATRLCVNSLIVSGSS